MQTAGGLLNQDWIAVEVLDQFATQGLILCPKTRQRLSISADGTSAAAPNGPTWRLRNGALDLYGQYGDYSSPPMATLGDLARDVAKALHFPESPEILGAVTDAVADTAVTASDWEYSAEIQELADRLGIPQSASQPQAVARHPEYNRDVNITFQRTFIEPVLPPATTLRRSVRIRNDGPTAIASTGERPLMMAYHWLSSCGTVIDWDGRRSPLLVELPPGGAVTVICEIDTPVEPGFYRLQFQPVIEGECWVTGDLLSVPVTIGHVPPATLPLAQTFRDYDYAADHLVGLALIEQHLGTLSVNNRPKILEVGGAIHPQANALTATCDVAAIDISFAMSQLGQLYFDHVDTDKRGRIAFIACDAHDPPFQQGTFDGAVIFSALHHFSDPKRLLVNLRRVLKPGGFIAVMCEPCVPNPAAEAYLRDLRKGINEQCWTVEEHGEIFLGSGLRLVSGQIDGSSLKVILS